LQDAIYEPAIRKTVGRGGRDIDSQAGTHRLARCPPRIFREACKQWLKIQTQRLKWPATDGMLSDCDA